ncbi:MAG TPA: hypothetical protein VF174_15735 [Micromonosporaceae bacterium]
MTHGIIEDSPRRCPWDGKRMVQEMGQHESNGGIEIVHVCWHCDYREHDTAWRDKRVTVLADYRERKTLAERLYEMRREA